MSTSASATPIDAAGPIRLLAVDDDPISGTLLFHLASLLGYVATVETDSQHAVDLALESDFDLMLLDLSMPNLDGFAALAQLHGRAAAAQRRPLPVIAVTGYASDEDRLRCLTAGFDEHLAKPVQVSALKATIERVLGKSGAPADTAAVTDADRLRATVDRLGAIRAGDRAFAPTVTESFALRSAQLIDALRTAVAARDAERTARAAQALRASAEFLGATRLASMTAALERDCSAAAWTAAAAQIAPLEHEHQAVLTLLFQAARR